MFEGCFIATACYGDYNSKEVLLLREFRDIKLLSTFFGRIFVKFYYLVSPFLASIISKSDFMKKIVRQILLDPILNYLTKR